MSVSLTTNNIHSVVAFGDSWTDNGNVFKLSNGTWPVYPSHRFTNDQTWVELLSRQFDKPLLNMAYGGATSNSIQVQGYSGPKSDIAVPCLNNQLDLFMNSNFVSNPNVLYTIWVGGNDKVFKNSVTADDTIKNIEEEIKRLGVANQQILVLNMPPLEWLPTFKGDKSISDPYEIYGLEFNKKLKQTFENTGILLFDVYQLFKSFQKYPKEYGFKEMTKPCWTSTSICDQPNDYLFWDDYHFTSRTNQIIANIVKRNLFDPTYSTRSRPIISGVFTNK
ncbi:hypothetical protein HDV02_006266 [Globomyces sp. JEL0801]|nr:hypothetical protein HDV02_006266 [Globomyces sp. JEL0801]